VAEAGHRDGELEPVQAGGQFGDLRRRWFLFLSDGAAGRLGAGWLIAVGTGGVGHGVTIGGSL